MSKRTIIVASLILVLVLTACAPQQAAPADNGAATINAAVAATENALHPAAQMCDLSYGGFSFNQEAGTTKTWTKADGASFTVQLEASSCNIQKLTDPAQPALQPTAAFTLTATIAPLPQSTPTSASAVQQPAGNCHDGEETGNNLNKVDRTPVADKNFSTVQETSNKPGPGTGYRAYYRWISVIGPLGTDRQVFINNVETIHELRYCGSVAEVQAYLSNPDTHIWAMRATAADGSGNIPALGDIPVVYVDPINMTVTFLVAGTTADAPTLDYIKAHIEIVNLNP